MASDFASAKAITLGLRPEDADDIFGAEAPSGAFRPRHWRGRGPRPKNRSNEKLMILA